MKTLPLPVESGIPLHAPELYQPEGVGFGVERLDDIGAEEAAFFREQGYLMVRRAFDTALVQSALQGLLDLIMGRNPDFKEISFEVGAQAVLPHLGPEERQDVVRKLMLFVEFEPRLKAISHHPGLLAAVRRLLGGREPHLFQDMALIKPPHRGREKPWHQDNAYFKYPQGTPVVGVWIALDEATIANGCMQFLPGRHKDGPRIHFQRRDWQICDSEILGQKSVAAPLPPGGLLLFDGLLPHGTPHNATGLRRRALQFHYAPADAALRPDDEERLRLFGSEGRNVSC